MELFVVVVLFVCSVFPMHSVIVVVCTSIVWVNFMKHCSVFPWSTFWQPNFRKLLFVFSLKQYFILTSVLGLHGRGFVARTLEGGHL